MNTLIKYTRTAMALHWLVALLMLSNIVLIGLVDVLPEARIRWVIDTHKSLGITVLGLAVLRLLWRYTHRPPELPGSHALWERRTAHIAHSLLYTLIFLLPLSGWMHDSAWKDASTHPMQLFGLVAWPRMGWIMSIEPVFKEILHSALGLVHQWGGFALYTMVALHVAGALKHQWLDKERALQRIWF